MFPSFYLEEGENFVAFVTAYYEWLEQNHQLLTLESNTDFNVGDSIIQDDITGRVVAFVGNDILVFVDDNKTFKCFNVCSELIPITSSSGGNSYILRGGTTKRMGPIFWARNLLNIRDIDTTVDLFIVKFKEKYLKNIEFDVRTNKELLIKNALNLYRSKGTERAVDLFFRLVYGTNAKVIYPGENLFRLSDGEWTKPRYIEITGSSAERTITLVGKQITGVTSGATAFVEKYIKRKIKNGFVHVLYLSNINVEFQNREILKADAVYSDSPKVVGSLTSVTVTQGSEQFSVGDIVTFNSTKGDYGLARVSEVDSRTGIIDFLFIDGGYGYTVSADSFSASELEKRTQSIISEKVLTLANVVTSNAVSDIAITSGGSGYANGDRINVPSRYTNATAVVSTNATGGISYITLTNPGSGFITVNPSVTITNSIGGTSTGTSAVLVANATEQSSYFRYFEQFRQRLAEINYRSATNASALAVGSTVTVGNSTVNAVAVIIESSNVSPTVGNLVISIANNSSFTGNSIILVSNSSVNAVVNAITNTTATATVMGVPNTGMFAVSSVAGSIELGDEIYQLGADSRESGNARIVSTALVGSAGSIEVENLRGVIRSNRAFSIRDRNTTGNVDVVDLNIGLYEVSRNFTNNYGSVAFSVTSGTTANVTFIGSGYGASFKVGTITESETLYLNTDLLGSNNRPVSGANQQYMTLPIRTLAYGFPKNPLGNSSTTIFTCLNFDNFTIGTIASLEQINPGVEYNLDPFVLAYQPYISGFNYRDYDITFANSAGSFLQGEKILQTTPALVKFSLVVSEETGFEINDTVYQSNSTSTNAAVGIIDSITPSLNTIIVRNTTAPFVPTNGTNSALFSVSAAQTAIVYNAAVNNQLYTNGSQIQIGKKIAFAGNSVNVIVSSGGESGYIVLGTANTALLSNDEPVLYYVPSTNTAIGGLVSNTTYYVRSVNSTAIQLANQTGSTVSLSSTPATAQQHQLIKVRGIADIRSNANSTLANANGTMFTKVTTGTVIPGDTIYLTANLDIQANAVSFSNSILSATIISVNSASSTATAKAIVKTASSSTLKAKRIQFDNLFTVGSIIEGTQSGATAIITGIAEDPDVLPIGFNAAIQANTATANGSVIQLQVLDSGLGYANNEDLFFVSSDGDRTGRARARVSGLGTGSGFYKTSRGFLSSLSKVHDGDYYQEYSYEILSRMPFDRYKDMFKKVLHTAGTRVFGSVVLEESLPASVALQSADHAIQLANTKQFNSNSSVVNSAIFFTNVYGNSSPVFTNGQRIRYTAVNGNSAIIPLANNAQYFVVNSTPHSIQLVTNPRATINSTFNKSTSISGNSIALTRHNFVNNDVVRYTTSVGNSALSGLSNNGIYHIIQANSSHVKLATSRGGTQIALAAGTSENGHKLAITTINIIANSTTSGTLTSGHFIAHVNEI